MSEANDTTVRPKYQVGIRDKGRKRATIALGSANEFWSRSQPFHHHSNDTVKRPWSVDVTIGNDDNSYQGKLRIQMKKEKKTAPEERRDDI